jgi:hypothetical protein
MNEKKSRLPLGLLLGGLTVALVGSAWSLVAGSGCGSCQEANGVFPGRSLAGVGTVYYSALLSLGVFSGPSLVLSWGTLLAGGVHAGLGVLLLYLRAPCPPCLLAAAGAALAVAGAIALDGSNAFRASLVTPGAAFLVEMWALLAGALSGGAAGRRELDRVEDREFAQASKVERGTVRMVAYLRPECGHCIEFEERILPELKRSFGSRLTVERRSAAELPGIPTPTLILSGGGGRHLFPGLPPREVLETTIETLMGGRHGD